MVVSPGFRVFVCNTVTGKITADLPVTSASWAIKLNDAGSVQADFQPRSKELSAVGVRAATMPLYQSLGVSYGDRILECGPIFERSYKGGTMTITASGLWAMFDHRKTLQPAALLAGADVVGSTIELTGSLGDIARELVRMSIEDNPFGALNIVLPDIEGGSHMRSYPGYELAWIGDRLRQLTGVQNGPDMRFRPRFSGADATVVEWVLETGTEINPLLEQTGQDWVWDGSAEQSGVVDFDHDEDASGMGSVSWTPGAGQERGMLLGVARDTRLAEQGYPWMEIDEASKDVESEPILDGSAQRRLQEAQLPWETIGIRVRADTAPLLGEYQPGDWAQIIVPEDHPTLDPGSARVRIMGISGTAQNTVTLALAPLQDTDLNTQGAGQTVVDSDAPGHLPGSWAALPEDITWADLPPGTWREL